jgi:Mrp family chromosome partitioning ATPase
MRSIVIHVTSAHHGEGATTISREIAMAAAATGWCKVALVDAGFTQPPAQAAVSRPGLVDYFERGEEPILRLSRIGSLPVATGSLSSNGRPVTRVESARGLYASLRSNFNLVVVDCPPVINGQQAAALASVADGVVLVVEAERTHVVDIIRARETLEQLGASIIGLVLNKRRRRIPKFISRFL